MEEKIREEGKRRFREYAEGQMDYISILSEMGFSKGEAVEFMKMQALQSILTCLCVEGDYGLFGVLGEISVSLDKLAECISGTQEGSRFCITGDVANYNMN